MLLVCNDGSWLDLERLPDCKADCPRYQLPEGYEARQSKRALAEDVLLGDGPERRLQSPFSADGNTSGQSRRGVLHGTIIAIQCADRDNRVPGAVESVKCTDGQWSTLSLVCGKDCQL